MVPSRSHEFRESKFPFITRIKIIRWQLSIFSAHAYGSLSAGQLPTGTISRHTEAAGTSMAQDRYNQPPDDSDTIGFSRAAHWRAVTAGNAQPQSLNRMEYGQPSRRSRRGFRHLPL